MGSNLDEAQAHYTGVCFLKASLKGLQTVSNILKMPKLKRWKAGHWLPGVREVCDPKRLVPGSLLAGTEQSGVS